MAFLEQRGEWFRIVFTFRGERFTHSVHTTDKRAANAIRGGIDRTIHQIQQRLVLIPKGADVKEFILTGGQSVVVPTAQESTPTETLPPTGPLTLAKLKEKYLAALGIGSVEQNSLDTVAMHLRHFDRSFGQDYPIGELTMEKLQEHVARRAKAKGIRKRPLSPVTMRKEIASLRAAWNWAVHAKLLTGPFPNKGLKFPKTTEKPPFQTWEQIARQIAQSALTAAEQQELWDCLFLGREEIEELLKHVQEAAIQPWVYPMFCFASHTGARRSEIIRSKLADLDLDGGSVRIHEKKRVHGHRTSRRVALSAFLTQVLRDWLAVHPGGPHLFTQNVHVFRSKKKRGTALPISHDEAHDHFKRTLAGSKWQVLRGWHALRHSFCSCCAAKGVDQRLINSWVGHQTEEMVQRYRHLFPAQERQAIQLVFG